LHFFDYVAAAAVEAAAWAGATPPLTLPAVEPSLERNLIEDALAATDVQAEIANFPQLAPLRRRRQRKGAGGCLLS
jgi:hypothetical protein